MPKFTVFFSIDIASKKEAERFAKEFVSWVKSVGITITGKPEYKFLQEQTK